MRKPYLSVLVLAVCLVLLPAWPACAEKTDSGRAAELSRLLDRYNRSESLDERLEIIRTIARDYPMEMAAQGYFLNDMYLEGKLPEGLIPQKWSDYPCTEHDGFPEEALGHPCIVLMDGCKLAAGLLVRFPAEMIAPSLAEAEYAVVITERMVESGYVYTPAAVSYHRDYDAYLLSLGTGEAVHFWHMRQFAAYSGYSWELNGKQMNQDEIWEELRGGIVNSLNVPQEDGSVLVFGLNGDSCFLKGYEGEPTDIVIPEQVDGYPVTEIEKECFTECRTLRSVTGGEALMTIGDSAFEGCLMLESFSFPLSLRSIGESAFDRTGLKEALLPEGLHTVGENAFCTTDIVTLALPGTLRSIGTFAFGSDEIARIIVGEGMTGLPEWVLPGNEGNVMCIYLPRSLTEGLTEDTLNTGAVVYAPEGSYAFQWAQGNGYAAVACENPEEMPPVRRVSEGDFDFLIYGDEAALLGYRGNEEEVVIPEEASGCPVTVILTGAFDYMNSDLETLRLPKSLRQVRSGAIRIQGYFRADKEAALYVPGSETEFAPWAVLLNRLSREPVLTVTFYAPEGSPAERYVADMDDSRYLFTAWGGE